MTKIIFGLILSLFTVAAHAQNNQPKLILQIVVDQLRGDFIRQHQDQFVATGFNYLLTNGIDFQNTHHPHANTTTCAGHATIATGAYPSLHGVIDNSWYNRKTKQMIYCMEDASTNILPTSHTHKKTPGRSARNLRATTLSDELILANKGKAYAVSFKDRSAISLAGHAGKAFWFDKTNGGFITSNYYFSSYPDWVVTWNKSYVAKPFDWKLSQPGTNYKNAGSLNHLSKIGNFGENFPHHVVKPETEVYFESLAKTPKADQLTAEFAEQLLTNEKLGITTNKTDYLAISFSATDAIGHQFGASSMEAEDNLLQLDKTIEHLLAVVSEEVGLENTLVILTADHGIPDSPTNLQNHHIRSVKALDTEGLTEFVKTQLANKYKLPPETLLSVSLPFIYLDHQLINDRKLDLSLVSQYITSALNQQSGVFKAFALPVINTDNDWLIAKVNRMAYPLRSGDIYVVPPSFQSNDPASPDLVEHGSPWQYDTYVPLIFAHPSFEPGIISRPVSTTDIAPTLSALLLIKSPSAAVGQPIAEVLMGFNKKSLKS